MIAPAVSSPHRSRPVGASPVPLARRSDPRRALGLVRRLGAAVSALLIVAAVAATSLRAGGEGRSAEKPRAAKAKGSKAPLEKKAEPLLPFLQRPEQKDACAEVEASSLAPALKEKMIRGEPLSLAQIEDLARAGLNPELVVKCLRTAGGSYALLTKDIDRLRAAGLADSVLDYLLTTRSHRATYYYPPLYYPSSRLYHYDYWHHYDHHFDSLHHSGTHLGDTHHR